jgi:type II secretion system protein E
MEELIKSIDEEKLGIEGGKEIDAKKMQEIVEEPVVIKLVNLIIMEAVRQGASDIHLEPEEETFKTRFRIDGILHEVNSPPKHLQLAITSRIKIMANLDIAERRIPQDGRFTIKAEGRQIDVRVSCMSTIYGENVVLRLLDVSSAFLKLEQLGFSKAVLDNYNKLITRPHGIILVTGPTGSGKTTTLYASLEKINSQEKNIITIEDPVEYKLAGIRQIQVNPKVKLTFANGLRSILRQDPDIIMVGEIRDFETAEISIQAALAGQLVFSTLHTNDAPGAITRLIDMGIEPFLASAVIGVLAQRLVRKICLDCKERYTPTPDTLTDTGLNEYGKSGAFYRGKGCPKCMNSGYKGRIGIYELMLTEDKIREAILSKAPADELRRLASAAGMLTLMESGIEKIKQGLTTLEEVFRVTREE